jgi:hypothetical protein
MLFLPLAAYGAEPAEMSGTVLQEEDPGPSDRIQAEFRYADGETIEIPEFLEQFGRGYRLESQTPPKPEADLPQTRTYTYRVDGTVSADQLSNATGLGDVTLSPVQHTYSRQVDKTEDIENMPANDLAAIPTEKTYDILENGIRTQGDLKLAEAAFTVDAKDAYGLPTSYTANVTYRGQETYVETLYYLAQGTYTRTETVGGGPATYVVVATYAPASAVEITAPTAVEENAIPRSVPQEPEEVLSVFQRAVITLGVVALAAMTILFLMWLNKRKTRFEKEDFIGEKE